MRKKPDQRRTTISRGVPNRIVLGRKFCARCGHWRHACDFRPEPANASGLRSYCAACDRIRRREAWASATPEQRQLVTEYRRIWAEVNRRKQGVPVRNFQNRRTVVDRTEYVFLPRDPLVALIESANVEIETLARSASVPQKTIARWRTGESGTVRLDCADRVALALGVPLWALYGDTPLIHGTNGTRRDAA
jgi:hypothetical protein